MENTIRQVDKNKAKNPGAQLGIFWGRGGLQKIRHSFESYQQSFS